MAATNSINISIQQQGAREVVRAIEDIGRGADVAASSVQLLKGALAVLGIESGLAKIAEQLNIFQDLQNRIKIVTEGVGQQAEAWNALVAAAVQVRAPIENLTLLYQRMALAGKDLHASQQDIVNVAENLNAAMILSGTGATEARGAIIQLSQSLSSGAMDGREWLSVSHEIPVVARGIAQGLREMAGSAAGTAVLRKTMTELDVEMLKLPGTLGLISTLVGKGAITSQVLFEALRLGIKDFGATVGTIPTTITQAFNVLSTRLLDYIGTTDKALGGSQAFAGAIKYVADNLDLLRKSVEAVGIAMAIYFGPSVIGGIIRSLATLGTTLASFALLNPFSALTLAAAAAIGYIVAFERDSKAANVTVGLFKQGVDGLKTAWTALGDAYKGLSGVSISEGFQQGLSNMRGALSAFIPLAAGLFVGLGAAIAAAAENAAEHFGFAFQSRFATMKNWIADLQDAWNKFLVSVGALSEFRFADRAQAPERPAAFGQSVGDAFQGGFGKAYEATRKSVEEVNKYLDGIVTHAEVVGRRSGEAIAGGITTSMGALTFTGPAPQGPMPSTGKTLDTAVQPNAARIADALASVGANETAIAGFLANFQAESHFDPTQVNAQRTDARGNHPTNFGQWYDTRYNDLSALGDPKALETGIALMKKELTGSYAGVLAAANAASNRDESTRVIAEQYEVFGKRGQPAFEAELAKRQQIANAGTFASTGTTSTLGTVSNPQDSVSKASNLEIQAIQNMDVRQKATIELDKATRALAEAQAAVDAQYAAGNMTEEKHNQLTQKYSDMAVVVKAKLQDQLEPLNALLRPLQEQVKYMDLYEPSARAAAQATDKMVDSLRKQGVVLSGSDRDALAERVKQLEHIKEVKKEQDTIYSNSSAGATEQFATKMEALNKLMKDGKLTVEEYGDTWAKAKADVLEKSDSMFDGIEAGLLRVSTSMGTTAKVWSDAVTSVFSDVENTLTTLATTGKASFSDLMKSITADLTKGALKAGMKELFGLGGSGEGGGGGVLSEIFGTALGGGGKGGGKGGGGSSSAAQGGLLGKLFGSVGGGGGGGLLGALFGGSSGEGASSPLGDYWLSYAQGLGGGADAMSQIKENPSFDEAAQQALKQSATYWGGKDYAAGFAAGGQFFIPGQGGTDTVPVQFMATPGERVTVETPIQQAASRLNGYPNHPAGLMKPGYAEGGDFEAGGPQANFTAPDAAPDFFSNESGPFLTPGPNQPSDTDATDRYRRLSAGGALRAARAAAPPPIPDATPSPAAESAAIFAASSKTPEFAAEMRRISGMGRVGRTFLVPGEELLYSKSPLDFGKNLGLDLMSYSGAGIAARGLGAAATALSPGLRALMGDTAGSVLAGDALFLPQGARAAAAASEAAAADGVGKTLAAEAAAATTRATTEVAAAKAGRQIGWEYNTTGLFGGSTTRTIVGEGTQSAATAAAGAAGFSVGGAIKGAALFPLRHPFLTGAGVFAGTNLLAGLTGTELAPIGPLPLPSGKSATQLAEEMGGLPPGTARLQDALNRGMPAMAGNGGANGIVPAGAAMPGGLGPAAASGPAVAGAAAQAAAEIAKDPGVAAAMAADGGGKGGTAAKDAIKKAVDKKAADKKNKGGIGPWGWAGLAAGGLAAAGLLWYLLGQKKKGPPQATTLLQTGPHNWQVIPNPEYNAYYNTPAWPNPTGAHPNPYAFAEGGEFTVGGGVLELPSTADALGNQLARLDPLADVDHMDPDVGRMYNGTFFSNKLKGYADGGDFDVSDTMPFGGAKASDYDWRKSMLYQAPEGQYLPMAGALAQRDSLTEQGPVGLPPRSLLDTLSGYAGQAGGFITKGLFGGDTDLFGGGLLKGLFGARDGAQFTVPGFAFGGEFDVGGMGGTDSSLVAFKGTPGEHVTVTPPANVQHGVGSSGGPQTVNNWTINTPDADSFQRSKGQIAATVGQWVDRQTRRNS